MTLSVIKLKDGNLELAKNLQIRESMFVAQAIELAARKDLNGLLNLKRVWETTPANELNELDTIAAIDKAIGEVSKQRRLDLEKAKGEEN